MENTTNNSFEEQWQKAFDDASLPPSEAVWEKIELDLGNNIPLKSGNNSYYIGVISAVILGVSVWFFMKEKEVPKQVQIIENKTITPNKRIEEIASIVAEKPIIKPKENSQIKKIFVSEKEKITEPQIVTQIPEESKRIFTDSINFMSPIIITKRMNSELINSTINIPFEQVPYYEVPKPVFKKKSIWDKVKFSGSVGIYQ